MEALSATHEAFVAAVHQLYQRYDWEGVVSGDVEAVVQDPRYAESGEERLAFLAEKAAAWGVDPDTMQAVDPAADRERYKRRLADFIARYAGEQGRDDLAELEAGDEDEVFAMLHDEYNIGPDGMPNPDPEETEFCLAAFYAQYHPPSLQPSDLAPLVNRIVHREAELDAVIQGHIESGGDFAGAVADDWVGEGHSVGALRYRFERLFAAVAPEDPAVADRVAEAVRQCTEGDAPLQYVDYTRDVLAALGQDAATVEQWAVAFPASIRRDVALVLANAQEGLLEDDAEPEDFVGGDGDGAGGGGVSDAGGDVADIVDPPRSTRSARSSAASQGDRDPGKPLATLPVQPPQQSLSNRSLNRGASYRSQASRQSQVSGSGGPSPASVPRNPPSAGSAAGASAAVSRQASGVGSRAASRQASGVDIRQPSQLKGTGSALGSRAGSTSRLSQAPPSKQSFVKARESAAALLEMSRVGAVAMSEGDDEADIVASRERWLTAFFDIFATNDLHRVPSLSLKTNHDLISILRSLYKQYKVSDEDAWGFSLKLNFTLDDIREDWRGRLEEFFLAQPRAAAAREAGRVDMERLLNNIMDNDLCDPQFWPTLYAQYQVPMTTPWPASQLKGAPQPRAPTAMRSSRTGSVSGRAPSEVSDTMPAARTGSNLSTSARSAGPPPSRNGSVRGVQASGSHPALRRSASRGSATAAASKDAGTAAKAKGRGTATGGAGALAIPGVLAFRHIDMFKVPDSGSVKRLTAAAKWDIAKAFGHAVDATHVDAMKGGVLVVHFHLAAAEEEAPHVYASAKQVLDRRGVTCASMLQVYRAGLHSVGGDPHAAQALGEIHWDRCVLRAPVTAEEHRENCQQLDAQNRADLRDKLAFFHVRHAPADIANVDSLMASKLEEVDLFKALFSRYALGEYDGSYAGEAWRARLQGQDAARSRGGPPPATMADIRARFTNLLATTEHFQARPEGIREKVDECVLEMQRTGVAWEELCARLDEVYRGGGGVNDTASVHKSMSRWDSPTRGPENAAGRTREEDDALRRRLTDFYLAHNPVELYKVELAMQAGLSEDVLFARLHEKYGLPPPQTANAMGNPAPPTAAGAPTSPANPHTPGGGYARGHARPGATAQDEQVLAQMRDLFKKERALQEEGATLEARERLLFEREVGLERSMEERERSAALRDASLSDWERQLNMREDTLRAREQSCDMRFREVADREARLAAAPPPSLALLNSRSLSPPPRGRVDTPAAGAATPLGARATPGAYGVASPAAAPANHDLHAREAALLDQEEKLKALSARLDAQVHHVAEREHAVAAAEDVMKAKDAAMAEREEVVAQREATAGAVDARNAAAQQQQREQDLRLAQREQALGEREKKMNAGQSSAGQIIEDHLRALEERESVVSAKEVALLQSTLRDKAQEQQREKRLASKEIEVDAKHAELSTREQELRVQTTRLNARQARLDVREKELADREGDVEERHRRMLFQVNEQSTLNLKAREVEEHAREIEIRDRLLCDREKVLKDKELEVAESEQAIKLAQQAELAALKEKERIFLQTEEELQTRARRLENEEIRLDGRRKDLMSTEEALNVQMQRIAESEARLAKALDDAEVRSSLVTQREATLEVHEAALRDRDRATQLEREEAQREMDLRQRDLDERRREVDRAHLDLQEKEGQYAVQAALLDEQERLLRRKDEHRSKKDLYMNEREWSVQQKEAMVGDTLRLITQADRDQETRFTQRMQRLKQQQQQQQHTDPTLTTTTTAAIAEYPTAATTTPGAAAATPTRGEYLRGALASPGVGGAGAYPGVGGYGGGVLSAGRSVSPGRGVVGAVVPARVDPLSPPIPGQLLTAARTISPLRERADAVGLAARTTTTTSIPRGAKRATTSSIQADLSSIRDSLASLGLRRGGAGRAGEPAAAPLLKPNDGLLSPRAYPQV